MNAHAEFLVAAVTDHAARVRELLTHINDAQFDSREWRDAVGGLIGRAEYLAMRAEELAALARAGVAP